MTDTKITFDEWHALVLQSLTSDEVTYSGHVLPAFASDEVQANTTGQSGEPTLKEAFTYFKDCVSEFERLGAPIGEDAKLLDFGAGWGRISRFFLRDIRPENLYGIDVTPDFVEICKRDFRSDNFSVCKPFPPTKFKDDTFNYITGYSVFSHLSEEACKAWFSEFARILAPGGIAAVTTRGRPFFDFCEAQRPALAHFAALRGDVYKPKNYLEALGMMFESFAEARAQYDRGEIVHSSKGVGGGGALDGSFYGETFIPKAYAQSAFDARLVLDNFMYDPSYQTHPIMFFRKK